MKVYLDDAVFGLRPHKSLAGTKTFSFFGCFGEQVIAITPYVLSSLPDAMEEFFSKHDLVDYDIDSSEQLSFKLECFAGGVTAVQYFDGVMQQFPVKKTHEKELSRFIFSNVCNLQHQHIISLGSQHTREM